MVDWLPGVPVLRATEDGGPQDRSYPPRLVLHTTEGGGTIAALFAYYHGSTFWPHFTADLTRHQLAQHIPFSRGGRALSHSTSTQTNDANCIQVEIIGHAAQAALWPVADVEWLGRALAGVLNTLGIRRSGPTFVAGGAGFGAPQRMTEGAWRVFNGVCGHQHVPENDHWDPGAFNLAAFLRGATPHTTEPDMHVTLDSPIVSYLSSSRGSWLLLASGAVITLAGNFYGTPFGKPYWTGRTASQLRANPNLIARIKHPYVVIDSTGATYGRNGF